MKPFENLNVTAFAQKYKLLSTFQYIENLFKQIEHPDVDGIAIASFADLNLVNLGDGHVAIKVDRLEQQVSFGEEPNQVYLRNNPQTRVLECSNNGTNWKPIGSDWTWPMIDFYRFGDRFGPDNIQIPVNGGFLYPFKNVFEYRAGESSNVEMQGGLLYPAVSTSPMVAVLFPCACRHAVTVVRVVIEFGWNDGYALDVDLKLSGSFDNMATWQSFPLATGSTACLNGDEGHDLILAKEFQVTPAGSPPFILYPKLDISGAELINYVNGCMISLLP